jgi:hypothetical protein
MRSGRGKRVFPTAAIAVLIASLPAFAAEVDDRIRLLEQQMKAMQAELEQLREERKVEQQRAAEQERETNVVAETVEALKDQLTIPEEIKLEGKYGLAPAASKVYGVNRGISIGGYGEFLFTAPVKDKGDASNIADLQRFVLYTGYKFNDWIVLNAEIEFEHATTSSTISNEDGGSVSVEFATMDFFFHEYANARAGLVLTPMGFINEWHEPTSFYGVNRPETERRIIPTTWREMGAGLFGDITEDLDYRMYGMVGFNAAGFDAGGVRGGRQNGSESRADDWAFVGRLDYQPLPSLIMGTSVYAGLSGQDQTIDDVPIPDTPTTIWEGHAQWSAWGLQTRALLAMAFLEDARSLTEALRRTGDIGEDDTIAGQMIGGYVEAAYDVLPWILPDTEQALSPYLRFEYVNTQWKTPMGPATVGGTFGPNGNFQDRIWTVGLDYKPIPQVVLKLDYRDFNPVAGTKPSSVNLGLGFVF